MIDLSLSCGRQSVLVVLISLFAQAGLDHDLPHLHFTLSLGGQLCAIIEMESCKLFFFPFH
jgi:hypothetical protein